MSVRKVAIGGGAVLAGLLIAPYFNLEIPNPFKTPAVSNIEKRYTIGGASPTHTPATASKRGDADHVVGNVEKPKGMGTPHWLENIGEQKSPPSGFDKKWNETHYGAEKGK